MLEVKDNLYIIRVASVDSTTLVKIGYSENMSNRLETYLYHNPLTEVVGTMYYEEGKELEKYIHRTFKSERFNEWYTEETFMAILEFIKSRSILINFKSFANTTDINIDYHKDIIDVLSPKEYYILMKLALKADKKSNRLLGYNSRLSASQLADALGIPNKRRIMKEIIEKLFFIGVLTEDEISWIMNKEVINS